MPYYVRAFCTTPKVPSIDALLAELLQRGLRVRAEILDETELSSPAWSEFMLVYDDDKQPIVVECNRKDSVDSVCLEECETFIAELQELEETPERYRMIEHLQQTTFIVACQLLSDVDADGYGTNDEILGYFVRHCGGLVYADGEGFYEGGELVLPM